VTKKLKRFSAAKLIRLRGDKQYHTLAVEITQRTGVDVHPDSIRKWETGTTPGGDKLAAMAAYFGISVDDLFE